MKKHFLTKDAAVVIAVGDHKFEFDATHFSQATGSYWGTLTLEDSDKIEALESVAKDRGITEITEEDFEKYEVKKKQPRKTLNVRNFSSVLSSQSQAPANAAEGDEPQDSEPRPVMDELEAENILTPKAVPPQGETLVDKADHTERGRRNRRKAK